MESRAPELVILGECNFNSELAGRISELINKYPDKGIKPSKHHCMDNIKCIKTLEKILQKKPHPSIVISVIDAEDPSKSPDKAERLNSFLSAITANPRGHIEEPKKCSEYGLRIIRITADQSNVFLILLEGGAEEAVEKMIKKRLLHDKYKEYLKDPRLKRRLFKANNRSITRGKIIRSTADIIHDKCIDL